MIHQLKVTQLVMTELHLGPRGSDSTAHFLSPDTRKGGEIGKKKQTKAKQNKAEEALGESLILLF